MATFSLQLRTVMSPALGLPALRSRFTVLYREHLPLCPGLSVKWTCPSTRSLYIFYDFLRRSQRLRCLKRRSPTARLKELRVRIPPGARMSVVLGVVRYSYRRRAHHSSRGVQLSVIVRPRWGGSGPIGAVASWNAFVRILVTTVVTMCQLRGFRFLLLNYF